MPSAVHTRPDVYRRLRPLGNGRLQPGLSLYLETIMEALEGHTPAWHLTVRARGLIPQPHGGALMPGGGWRRGAGRPKSRVKAALDAAKGDRLKQVRVAGEFVRGDSLPIGELIRAGTFLLNFLEKLEREEQRRLSKKRGFQAVRRSEDEMIAVAAKAEHRRRRGAPASERPREGVKRI